MKATALLILASLVSAAPIAGAADRTAPNDAKAVLDRARDVMGVEAAGDRVLHLKATLANEENYQSDRMYPPFFSSMHAQEMWLDPASGVLRIQSITSYPGYGSFPMTTTLDDGRNATTGPAEKPAPLARRQATQRPLNPWAVIADWSADANVTAAGKENYRDYDRLVLTRHTAQGEQRLLIDPKSGFPVKLEFTEPHYLWGQRRIEYVWTTWGMKDGVVFPGAVFRIADGDVEMSQTVDTIELMARASAPSLAAPAAPAQQPPDLPMFLRPLPPKVTKVGDSAFLLENAGYREVAVLAQGEIYVFDATQGEQRARQDAALIAQAFPGAHKVNVVVTDLAWPHIAGVRYWVSQGATIIAHRAARDFLQRVVDRRWTLAPDELEKKRAARPSAVHMHFVAVDHALSLAGGAIRVAAIDGIGSEVALMAYVPKESFLWASDFIQTLDEPTLYAREVMRAAERNDIKPERVAAEHLPLATWRDVVAAQTKSAPAGRGA